ncbi:MAG: nucleoside recognition domain-containing protein [Thermodesulfobacteriota bacterium]
MARPALLNGIWLWMVILAVLAAAWTGRMEATMQASFESAKAAASLALNLVGIMALWLGLMKVAEAGGLMNAVARGLRPLMVRLFPQVPAQHPAMAAMVMNLAANVLGLGNAATPLGIRAMQELDRLNPAKGTATDAMCLFLALNTSSVTLLPLGAIGVRAAAGSRDPAAILVPTLLATAASTLAAVLAAKMLARLASGRPGVTAAAEGAAGPPEAAAGETPAVAAGPVLLPPAGWRRLTAWLAVAGLAAAAGYRLATASEPAAFGQELLSFWLVPLIMASLLLYGYLKGVAVYETACQGAREGFEVAVRIIPFLVVILVGIGMFRASGAFDLLVAALGPLLAPIGMPVEALPMALMRPLSGSGAFAIMSEVVAQDPDSFASLVVGTINGCSETTFYVLAVYFGAVGVSRPRYTVAAALAADLVGVAAALAACHVLA